MKKIILLIIFCGFCLKLSAQNRISFGTVVNQTLDVTLLNQGMIKLGYEQTLTEHLTMGIGFGYLLDVSGFSTEIFPIKYTSSKNYPYIEYNQKYPMYMFEYQSRFFFAPTNDGVFIGTSISYKKYTENIRINNNNSYDTYTYKNKFTVIPVGLQLGIRTNGVDLATDFFVGMMFNANRGTANERSHPVPSYIIPYPDVKPLSFQFGIMINAGWKREK